MNEKDEQETEVIRFVLGEMTSEETARFSQKLDQEPALRAAVKEVTDTFGSIGHSVPYVEPPDHLRKDVLEKIAGKPGEKPTRSLFPYLVVATVCSIILGLAYFNQRQSNHDLSKQLSELEKEKQSLTGQLTDANEALEQAKRESEFDDLKLAALRSELNRAYEVIVAWDEARQSGVLRAIHLPANQPGQDYQLWIIDKESAEPISGAVFHVSPGESPKIKISPDIGIHQPIAFALSLEKKGGVPVRQGPIVVQYGL